MLLVTLFLLLAGFLALTGLLSCRNIAGVLFCALFRSEKTVVLSCIVTADRQLVFVSPHLSVALSRRWKPHVGPRKNSWKRELGGSDD
jgi:hypothetical protein